MVLPKPVFIAWLNGRAEPTKHPLFGTQVDGSAQNGDAEERQIPIERQRARSVLAASCGLRCR
jgi:hypothetical protein